MDDRGVERSDEEVSIARLAQGIYGITKDDNGWAKKYKTSKNGNFARLYGATGAEAE